MQACSNCSHNQCTGHTREGRSCLAALNASRAVFWLPPVRQTEGGLRVVDDDSTRLRIERAAEPEPESPWPAIVGATLGFIAACLAAAACWGVQIF